MKPTKSTNSPVVGTCKLCGNERPLKNSHVLAPSWAFNRVLAGSSSGQFVAFDGRSAILTNNNQREHMLCNDCEQRFSVFENYVSTVTVQTNGDFPARVGLSPDPVVPEARLGPLDREKITRFAASIFWRMSVSSRQHFRLDPPFESAFHDYLDSDHLPFPSNACLIVSLASHRGRPIDQFILQARGAPLGESRTGHVFLIWGLECMLVLGDVASYGIADFVTTGRVFESGGEAHGATCSGRGRRAKGRASSPAAAKPEVNSVRAPTVQIWMFRAVPPRRPDPDPRPPRYAGLGASDLRRGEGGRRAAAPAQPDHNVGKNLKDAIRPYVEGGEAQHARPLPGVEGGRGRDQLGVRTRRRPHDGRADRAGLRCPNLWKEEALSVAVREVARAAEASRSDGPFMRPSGV